MPLTPEQLSAIRLLPLNGMPNKVRIARAMLQKTQTDVADGTALKFQQVSDIERGAYRDIPLENTRAIADYFGCQIEDLFPAREAVAS